MAKRAPSYPIVLAMLLVVGAAGYWVREKPVKVLFSANLAGFPMNVGTWKGSDMVQPPEIRKQFGADSYISRSYTAQDGETQLGLLAIYRKYGRREFVHRPEMCYPAAGYEIVGKTYTTVPYGGKSVRAVKITAVSGDEREIVVYWFASGERTEASFVKQQFWMALDRLRTQKYGWAFIRVNCPVLDSDEETMATIRGFLREASDPLVGILTGNRRAGLVSPTPLLAKEGPGEVTQARKG